jgi:ubiquinone/menaquinone biosynthesis C-methylase UbiE
VPEQHFGGDPAQGHGLSISSNELYGEIWAEDPSALKVELERSLAPRATTMLYDEFARLGVGPDDLVLDAGGRDAVHAIEIVRRLDCRAITIDPVPLHVDRARERVAAAGLEDRIDVLHAATESLPFEDASIDFVWCRDVLNHVQLDSSLREFARVLRPGGSVLVYQTFAETACEPEEARRLFAASASVAENMSAPFFEATAGEAGFEVVSVEPLRDEWRERMIEDGTWDVAADLLALSRLHRREGDAVGRYGRARVEAARGGLLWGIYQLLGKLCPTIYVLRHRGYRAMARTAETAVRRLAVDLNPRHPRRRWRDHEADVGSVRDDESPAPWRGQADSSAPGSRADAHQLDLEAVARDARVRQRGVAGYRADHVVPPTSRRDSNQPKPIVGGDDVTGADNDRERVPGARR